MSEQPKEVYRHPTWDLTIDDVLVEWWNSNQDGRYELDSRHARISCKTCMITWMRALGGCAYSDFGAKIEYALEPNGDVCYIDPADPLLFEKMSLVLKNVRHDPEYRCSNEYRK